MAETRRLSQLVETSLPLLELPPGPHVVALSGGADSAALALLCARAGVEVTAVHVDHQLPASPMMEKAAVQVAEVLDLAMTTIRVEVGSGPSLEELARDARYRALESVEGAVLTGHTRDDSAETMLINLIRGTGGAGLAGIPYHRPPNVYRPILGLGRGETREMAALAGLPFVDDPMNQDMSLTRNRVRLHLLPTMREINPAVDSALARAAAFLRRDNEFLDELADRHQVAELPVSLLSTLPRPVADRVVLRFLECNGVGAGAGRVDRVWSVATGESPRQDLSGGRSVVRRGAMLVVEPG